MLFVRGFGSKYSALAFEWAWQKPHSSRHTARMWSVLGMGKCSVRTSVSVRRRALSMLLEHEVLGCMSRSRFVRSRHYSKTTLQRSVISWVASPRLAVGGPPISK